MSVWRLIIITLLLVFAGSGVSQNGSSARATSPAVVAEGVLNGSTWSFALYKKPKLHCVEARSDQSTSEWCGSTVPDTWNSAAAITVGPSFKQGAVLLFFLAPRVAYINVKLKNYARGRPRWLHVVGKPLSRAQLNAGGFTRRLNYGVGAANSIWSGERVCIQRVVPFARSGHRIGKTFRLPCSKPVKAVPGG